MLQESPPATKKLLCLEGIIPLGRLPIISVLSILVSYLCLNDYLSTFLNLYDES